MYRSSVGGKGKQTKVTFEDLKKSGMDQRRTISNKVLQKPNSSMPKSTPRKY